MQSDDNTTKFDERSDDDTPASGGIIPISDNARELLKFSDIDVMEQFLKNIGWTPVKELQLLMNIIESTDNDNVRLRAMKQLEAKRNDMIKNSGLMVRATRVQQDAQGNKTVFSADVLASAFPKNKRSSNARQPIQDTEGQRATVPVDPEDGSQSGTTIISTESGATLHKPPVGTTGPDAIEPETRGSRTVPCRDVEGSSDSDDTTGDNNIEETEGVL